MRRVDDWCERFGDSVNPILVKETRQALKSRQFVVTFSVLLFAALAWTVAGSMMMMPQIYTSPSAPRMLVGYYVVLAIPLLLVVPLAAYRSLEGEIDDGTLELLTITALSPWQIVLGKLASATLQIGLYFVALLPCVAYAYTLRGVDLPTTALMIAILVVGALLLTIIAIFFAPLARGRTGRVATLLAVIMILMTAEYAIGAAVIYITLEGNPFTPADTLFIAISTLLIAVALGHLFLTATAAQLTPESENRSTPIRLSLLMLTTVVIGVIAYAIQMPEEDVSIGSYLVLSMSLAAVWTVCGSMMVAESPVMTPRIRRELPSSFLARSLLTWLTPGPATGLVFVTAVTILLSVLAIVGFEAVIELHGNSRIAARDRMLIQHVTMLYAGYFVGFLVCVRWIVAVVRLRNNPRVEIGLAAMVVVAVLLCIVPYSIGMHLNDYRSFDYSRWQITNWAWTLVETVDGRFNRGDVYLIVSTSAAMFATCLMLMTSTVLPRRIATPGRVEEEQAKLPKNVADTGQSGQDQGTW
ncbi:MAG: ABC transporter permease [Pirellulaceae bacterium]|nr:ABC transporter permease [Pirellulaceae bacterium]